VRGGATGYCYGRKSISKLKIIKKPLEDKDGQEILFSLALLSIESGL
jgi:hypothetical protein